MSALRSLLVMSLSASLGAAGCTKTDGDEAAKGEAAPEAKADETKTAEEKAEIAAAEGKPEGKSEDTVEGAPKAAPVGDPTALAAAVASMVDEAASYPAPLDPLLDLLPADPDALVVIRDLDDLLAVADSTIVPMSPAFRVFATTTGKGMSADDEKVLSGIEGFMAGMRGSDFDLSKGMVIGDVEGEAAVIYGASKPDALPTLLRSLGAEGDDMPDECAAIEGAAGYVVCTAKPETLAKYAPAKAAAAVRARLEARLEVQDVEHANVLALVAKDPDPKKQVAFGMATAPGLVHMTIGLGEVPPEAIGIMGKGESPGLGLVDPGSGFYWLKLDPKMIEAKSADAPFVARNMVKTLTGEMLLGTMSEPNGLVLLVGVNDPAPAGGLLAMAGLKIDDLPKTLPDGSTLEVTMETLTAGGREAQVMHATVDPAGEGTALLAAMGFVPEAWAFSVGGYAGVALGSEKTAVEAIGNFGGGVMSAQGARALPKPLASGLVDQTVALAVHIPLDDMQSPKMREAYETIFKELPLTDLPPGMTPAAMMSLGQAFLAPVSGMSMWMAPPNDRLTFHVAYSLLGDPRTEEGKAALAAMAEVAGGGDPAKAYGDLATRFGSSPRVTAYQARAGTRAEGALASAAILGVMSAIAIPAFTKYQERAREGSKAEMEAELAAAQAAAAAAEAAAAAAAK